MNNFDGPVLLYNRQSDHIGNNINTTNVYHMIRLSDSIQYKYNTHGTIEEITNWKPYILPYPEIKIKKYIVHTSIDCYNAIQEQLDYHINQGIVGDFLWRKNNKYYIYDIDANTFTRISEKNVEDINKEIYSLLFKEYIL
jgi:hypothetical protein